MQETMMRKHHRVPSPYFGSCKGAGSRRYHVLDYMKRVFLSIGLGEFFRKFAQNFFFVFVLVHKFLTGFRGFLWGCKGVRAMARIDLARGEAPRRSWRSAERWRRSTRRPPDGARRERRATALICPDYRSTVTSASCAPVISCSAFTLSSI